MNKQLRHFVFAFLIAVPLYFAAFYIIEYRRNVRGPWVVEFVADATGRPKLLISQASLQITNFEVHFEGSLTNAVSETVHFSQARQVPFPVPFGECVFLDGTFLPGTVTLRCFGHEIEMIPRVLILDHVAYSWTNKALSTSGR